MLASMFDVVAPDWPLPLPPALAPAGAIGRPEPADAAGTLLRTARWHAGLSQQELADRTGTSQQAIGRYESGQTQPTLPTLGRLLGSCGMALDHALVPLIDHDDEAIGTLLAREPVERLPQPQPAAVRASVAGLRGAGIDAVLTDKAAARVYGAPVFVPACEFVVDGSTVTFRSVEAALGRPTPSYWRVSRNDELEGDERDRSAPSADELDDEPGVFSRLWVFVDGAEIRLRAVPDFARFAARAGHVDLGGTPSLLASPADLVARWHEKDRDHLLLQRSLLQARRHEPRLVR
jgi:transcriptional regulator with XRE-family HTH domain